MRLFTNLHLWVYSLWSALFLYLAYFLVHQIWEILDMTLRMKSQLLNLQPQQVKFNISLHLLFNIISSLIFNSFQMITSQPLKFLMQVLFAKVRINLINNPRMFNLGIDDLAEKPYIPQKNLLLWICCKCLAWWHRHTYFWPPLRLLEAKHHTASAHFGTLTQCSVHPTVPKCAVAVWCLASNSLHGGQK